MQSCDLTDGSMNIFITPPSLQGIRRARIMAHSLVWAILTFTWLVSGELLVEASKVCHSSYASKSCSKTSKSADVSTFNLIMTQPVSDNRHQRHRGVVLDSYLLEPSSIDMTVGLR